MSVFLNGRPLLVYTRGAGKLHLLSYQNNASASNVVGSVQTPSAGVTTFLISFSHNYERFAFFWEGPGEAVYSVGPDLERKPVGKSWANANGIYWGDLNTITTVNVASIAPSAVDRTNATTIYIIPDYIL